MAKNEPKQPYLLKYLLSNIDKGIYPSKEELTEIQDELGTSHLGAINIALIDVINSKPNVQQRASQAPSVAPKKPVKQVEDPDRVMNPGDLGRKRVIRNARS